MTEEKNYRNRGITLSKEQKILLKYAKSEAIKMEKNGRALTGMIGELAACKERGLEWSPTEGYDAKDGTIKYQIKTRKNWTEHNKQKSWWGFKHKVDPGGTMGRFGGKKGRYDFDIGLYVELDEKFEIFQIWELNTCKLKEKEKCIKDLRKGFTVGKFKSIACKVFQSSEMKIRQKYNK